MAKALLRAWGIGRRNILRRLGARFSVGRYRSPKDRRNPPVLGELRYIRRFLDEVSAIEELAL